MNKGKYEILIKQLLGPKKYRELRNYTLKRVQEKFNKQNKYVTEKIIYANHSAILIVAALKAKKAPNSKIVSSLHIDLNNKEFFIEEDFENFLNVYSEYINILSEELKKRE